MNASELYDFLELKYRFYAANFFIETDPVSIPHNYNKKEDIEISAFLTATLSWGQRPVIIKNCSRLMILMEHAPHDFILNFTARDLNVFQKFVHRTFNFHDCAGFFYSLKHIYREFGSLEAVFSAKSGIENQGLNVLINNFRLAFCTPLLQSRSHKHIGNPEKGSACKRINMFLRWMVRKDSSGIDFGIWKKITSADLMLPLDVHTARVARTLGLLKRKQNDWKAVEEVTNSLRLFDKKDPVKYDFALFGLGVFENFGK